MTTLPAWADALDDTQRATLTADLAAEELCACGHRDDQHDADSVCLHNAYADMSHVCYAYAPVQR